MPSSRGSTQAAEAAGKKSDQGRTVSWNIVLEDKLDFRLDQVYEQKLALFYNRT